MKKTSINTVEIRHRFTQINAVFCGLIRHGLTRLKLDTDLHRLTLFLIHLSVSSLVRHSLGDGDCALCG